MEEAKKKGPEGLWLACEEMEAAASFAIHKQLSAFEPVLKACYEAGVLGPTLPGKRHLEFDTRLAALFLKKALNDLRSTWLLVRVGYTSQAASVAASLFENALTVVCLAGKPENLEKIRTAKGGDLPWTPQQLSKILADQWREEARITGIKYSQEDYELAWREVYAGYKWLCKLKHPTIGSASHDAGSTSLTIGEYIVMAAPDTRPEDVIVKATILAISTNRIREALRSFSFALECDTSTPQYKSFVDRVNEVKVGGLQAYKSLATQPLPIILTDPKLYAEWAKLKTRGNKDGPGKNKG